MSYEISTPLRQLEFVPSVQIITTCRQAFGNSAVLNCRLQANALIENILSAQKSISDEKALVTIKGGSD
jgi:hypothetical protein